jgi:hypothetical protein
MSEFRDWVTVAVGGWPPQDAHGRWDSERRRSLAVGSAPTAKCAPSRLADVNMMLGSPTVCAHRLRIGHLLRVFLERFELAALMW